MLGGGGFDYYNKILPGTYNEYETESVPARTITDGITAGGLMLDWCPDKQIFQITAEQFRSSAETYTGHGYNDPENQLFREIFKHANVFIGYKLNSNGAEKAKADGLGEAKCSGSAGNNITVSVLNNVANESKYDVITYFNGVQMDLQTVNGKSEKTVTVSKKGNQSNEKIDAPSATITAESNVVTVTYADMVSSYPTTATKVTKDGQAVEANIDIQSDGLVDTITFQEGTEDGKYKVEAIVKGADEKVLTSTEITKAESEYTKGEDTPGEAPEAPKVTFDFADKDVTFTFSDSLVEYPSPVVEVEPATGFTKTSKKITFNDSAESTDYTIKAYLKKSSVEKKLIATVQATVSVDETGASGADGSELSDNDFVVFEDGLIETNAGYVFEGGLSGTECTIQDHNDCLNAIEPYFFNALFCNSTDDTVKEVYVNNNIRLREERGKYFQTYVHDYVKADYEGVISVKNSAVGSDKASDIVCWTAGYGSAIDLAIELTNKAYDGELELLINYPQVQLEALMLGGNFLFHNIAIDDTRTLTDVNTLQTYTDKKGPALANNKLVRVIDYVLNSESAAINNYDIGTLKNNDEGRATLWNRCLDILSDLYKRGVLRTYNPNDVTVEAIPGQSDSVAIHQALDVEGTVRKVYVHTTVSF